MGTSNYGENGSNGSNGHGRGRKHHDSAVWSPPPVDQVVADDEQRFDLRQFLAILKEGRWAIALISLGVFSVVLAVTLASRMDFTIRGSIYMGDLKSQGGMLDAISSQFDFGGDKGSITTEIEILKSRKLMTKAVLDSGLNTRLTPSGWKAPRYLSWRLGHRDLRSLEGASGELRAVARPLYDAAQTINLDLKFKTPTEYDVLDDGTVIAHGVLAQPVSVPGFELTLFDGPERRPRAGSGYALQIAPVNEILDELTKNLRVSSPKGLMPGSQADIVHIELTSKSPYDARKFLDALMLTYLEQNLAWKTEEAGAAETFLSKQLENVRASLDKAGKELAEFKKQSATVELGEEAKSMIGQIGTLEQQRVAARLQVESLQQVKAMLAKGNVPTEAYLVGEAQDSVLIAMSQSLVKAQQEYQALAQQFTPDYPPLKEARAGLDSQLKTVRSYVDTRLRRARDELASLGSAMDRYTGRLKELPDAEFKLVTLTQASEVYSRLYEFLLERQQQAALTKASTISKSRVLDSPTVPTLEESPRLRIRFPLGLLFGLFLGIGFVLVRSRLSSTYRSEAEIRKMLPGLSVFSLVPKVKETKEGPAAPTQPLEFLAADLRSPFAEAFRLLRTNLYYSGSRDRDKVVVVSSPEPGDGKTITTLCLAGILAADGKRVLVVDGDMRKPSHHILLRTPQQPGLSGVLNGDMHWTEAVRVVQTPFGEFSSITTGITPPNPAELLSTPHLATFLTEARAKFDFVLVDSPPFPLVSDALVLSHSVDRVLTVIRVGATDRRVTQEHVRRLAATTSHYGCVINDISAGNGYGYGYGYGYGADVKSKGKKRRFLRRGNERDQRPDA